MMVHTIGTGIKGIRDIQKNVVTTNHIPKHWHCRIFFHGPKKKKRLIYN
jgi:hypothetical protein